MPGQPDAPVVVVGGGIAGVSAVVALRAEGYAGPLVLVSDEPHLPYRRPTVSKELVRGARTVEQVRVKPEQWYADREVDLRRGRAAVALDPAAGVVRLDSGEELAWSQLVLATGGRARTLPGVQPSPRIRTLRTAADTETLVASLEGVDRVVVVGAGLIGAEIAASLRELGRDVVLLEGAPLPLPRLLPAHLGEVYAQAHRARGVTVETGVDVREVVDEGGLVRVGAADGRAWSAPLVVVAVGMEPELSLARAAGLELAGPLEAPTGVLVDGHGRTSADGVWAAGDATVRPSSYLPQPFRAEHWQAAQNHGTAVGRSLAGVLAGHGPGPMFDEVPWAWSDQYALTLQVTGWPETAHDVVLRGTPTGADDDAWVAFFLDDGVLRGAVGVGLPREIRAARALVADRAYVDPRRLADPAVPVEDAVTEDAA